MSKQIFRPNFRENCFKRICMRIKLDAAGTARRSATVSRFRIASRLIKFNKKRIKSEKVCSDVHRMFFLIFFSLRNAGALSIFRNFHLKYFKFLCCNRDLSLLRWMRMRSFGVEINTLHSLAKILCAFFEEKLW